MSAASTNGINTCSNGNTAVTCGSDEESQHSLQSDRRVTDMPFAPLEMESEKSDEDEMISLLNSYSADFMEVQSREYHFDPDDDSSGSSQHIQPSVRKVIMMWLAFAVTCAILLALHRNRNLIQDYIRIWHLPVRYSCPRKVHHSQNDKDNAFDIYKVKNKEYYLSHYREQRYGGWGISYGEMKELLKPWKTRVFAPNLKDGDVIYESAMGRGLNLLMTSEILNDLSVNDLTVYGNDYLDNSVSVANSVWDLEENSMLGQKGIFCLGDSTNLRFVPASSFDLVYSGYIDPIGDPLGLDSNGSSDTEIAFCLSNKAEEKAIAARAQSIQEQWYEQWILEMIQLVKPGGIVAVEMTGFPLVCLLM